jgi:hypothetical protein
MAGMAGIAKTDLDNAGLDNADLGNADLESAALDDDTLAYLSTRDGMCSREQGSRYVQR